MRFFHDPLSELTPQTREFFNEQSRSFFTPNGPDTGFRADNKTLANASQVNCADFHHQFMNCLSNGPFKERMLGCSEQQVAWDTCLGEQMKFFHELRLEFVKDEEMFVKGVKLAQGLDGKDGKEVLDKRDELWR